MRKTLAVLLLAGLIWCANAQAQNSGLGLGVLIGEPTGISAKLWLTGTGAVDAAAAWSTRGNNSLHLHADYLHHFFGLFPVTQGKLPLYVGAGGRIRFAGNPKFGARVPVGLAYLFPTIPVDIFLEIAPIVDLAPDTGFDINGGIGARYYFR